MNEENLAKKPQFIYCNGVQIALAPYELTFLVNQNTPLSQEAVAEIVMSPEHAKVFSAMLAHNIKEYESIFGNIPDVSPESMDKLLESGKISIESGRK